MGASIVANWDTLLNSTGDRRGFLRVGGLAAAAMLAPVSGCTLGNAKRRGFLTKDVVRWSPAEAMRDIGFRMLSATADGGMDYLDAECSTCRTGVRYFLLAVDVGSAITIPCPSCSVGLRVTAVVSRFLFKQMLALGIDHALAVPWRDGYFVHQIAAAQTSTGSIAVARGSLSYDIKNREPVGTFDRRIGAVPNVMFNFTEVVGAKRPTSVIHVWRKNGQTIDRIRLEIGSARWRTWSNKRNLAPGVWTVATELPSGEVLSVREFLITG